MPGSLDFYRRTLPTVHRGRGLNADERAQRATTLDPEIGPTHKRARREDTGRVLQLLSQLVEQIEGRGLDSFVPLAPGLPRLIGLTPENEAQFDTFLAEFLDQITDQGQIAQAISATRTRLAASALGVTRRTADKLEPTPPWYEQERQRLGQVLRDARVQRAVRSDGDLPVEIGEQIASWLRLGKTLAKSPNANRQRQAAQIVGTILAAVHDAFDDQSTPPGQRLRQVAPGHYVASGHEPRRKATNRITAIASSTGQKSDWIDPAEATIDAAGGVRRRTRKGA